MAKSSVDPSSGSDIVPIPDPSKLLDPVYLTAHALVDKIERAALARLIPRLMPALSPGEHLPGDSPPVLVLRNLNN